MHKNPRAILPTNFFHAEQIITAEGRKCCLCCIKPLPPYKRLYCSEYCNKLVMRLTRWRWLRDWFVEKMDYTCALCSRHNPYNCNWVVDHITPLFKGGSSLPINLQLLCAECNSKKTADDFRKTGAPSNKTEHIKQKKQLSLL